MMVNAATLGPGLDSARMAVILVHGRGASAQSILELAPLYGQDDVSYLAPQAPGGAWYPQRFIAPLEANEPWLSNALAMIDGLVAQVTAAGLSHEQLFIGGFSQGACLAVEYVARHPQRYGGAFAYSGGLIGPEGMAFDYPGDLAGTPIFLGCSDTDFHIPLARVQESTAVLQALGAEVTERIYPGIGHTVNQEEIDIVRGWLSA